MAGGGPIAQSLNLNFNQLQPSLNQNIMIDIQIGDQVQNIGSQLGSIVRNFLGGEGQ